MYRTFNVGLGMVIVCSPSDSEVIENHVREFYRIGEVVTGNREVLI
jgi:phosphoribosylaminoimidazole (AIR) synthetase